MAKNNSQSDTAVTKWWDEATDVIIAGGSYAGIAAAVAASERGTKVILLEKEKDSLHPVGRDGRGYVGMFAVESTLQQKAGIDVTKDWAFKFAVEHSHWRINAPLVRKLINGSADLVKWLVRHGQVFKGVSATLPDYPMVWHEFENQSLEVIRVLTKAAAKNSVKLLYNTRATDLIIGPEGQIVGIKALSDSRTIKIRSKAVIMCAGGATPPSADTRIKEASSEEGTAIAGKAGAAIDYLEEYTYGFGVKKFLPPEFDEITRVTEQPLLWVNKSGERVFDEGLTFQPEMLLVASFQEDKTLIQVFDESTKNNLMTAGVKYLQHGTKFQALTKLDEQIEKALKIGIIEQAPKIRDLAARINVDPDTLENTVSRYNQFCDKKYDAMFLKNPRYLEPVRQPPFFAIVCNQNLGFALTKQGGVRINNRCQALDGNSRIITGLYAAGKNSAGVYGNMHPSLLCGVNMTYEIGTGRIAGESASEFVNVGK